MLRRSPLLIVWFASVIFLLASFTSFAATPQVDSGLLWLSSSQTSGGNWLSTETSEYYSTASSLEAVFGIDPTNPVYAPAYQWLSGTVVSPTDYLSRRIMALKRAGDDISGELASLVMYRNPDGGWGGEDEYTSNSLDTALALQALKAANYSDTTVLYQAINFLTTNQNPDGGWGFRPTTGVLPGDPSNVYMTAIVSSTLQLFPQSTTLANAISRASAYLLSHQNPDGGFGSSPSTVYETALAFKALFNVTTDATVLGRAVNYFTDSQLPNGSWNDDPYSTALALQALHLSETRPSTPPPAPTTGTVTGTVVDASTNQSLRGVTVTFAGNTALATSTDTAGAFSLANIPEGSQQITFSLSGYDTAMATMTVTAGSIINIGNIPLSTLPTTGIVRGTVTDAASGSSLAGVAITVTGASTWTAVTEADGSYRIPDIAPGSVNITASYDGYYTISAIGAVTAGGTLVFSPALSTVPPSATTGGLKGVVMNAMTSLPVQGASVTITPDPAGTGPVTSNPSGAFSLNNIDPGTYTVSIAAEGYTGQVYTATVIAGAATDLGAIALAPILTSTTVTGIVKDAVTGNPIAGTEVAVIGTGLTAVTDATGAYTLSGVPLLEFNLKASVAGYDSLMFILSTTGYGSYAVDFPLIASRASDLKIVSLAADKPSYPAYAPVVVTAEVRNSGSEPLSGTMSLTIANSQGQVVDYRQATTVDPDGTVQNSFLFQPGMTSSITIPWETKDLPPGAYTITAKVITGVAGVGGGATVTAEGSAQFGIEPTQAIAELVLMPRPKFTNLGATEQISLQATLANRSNTATEVGIAYEWHSPSGIVLRSGTGTISLVPAESSKSVTLDNFPFTFTESGVHPVSISILNGPTPANMSGGMVSVAPAVRIEPSQSISPATVVPDGDKRIRMQIRLKGVEQK